MKNLIKYFIFIFAINIIAFQSISAQSNQDSLPEKCLNREYIKSYFYDAKNLVISPSKWTKKEWITAGSIIATTAVVYAFDDDIADFSQKYRSKSLDNINEYFFDPYGKMYYTVPVMGAFYLYGLVGKKTKPKVVALDFVKASAYSGIIITGIKHLAHRQRPYQTIPHNQFLWDGPITSDWNHTSFPSGHTIMAWTFASVLATHYQDHLWIPITVYSLATLEGMARIYADKHWTSDVIIGAALGYAIGKWVVNNNKYCNLSITPAVGSNYNGLKINLRFGQPKKCYSAIVIN